MKQHAKNPAAVALGRLGGKIGGKKRAANQSPEERRESARRAVMARWAKERERGGSASEARPKGFGGRKAGLKGGKARAQKLTPEQRAEIARKAAQARWGKGA